jgi:membrane associated rhomboid family serine protease
MNSIIRRPFPYTYKNYTLIIILLNVAVFLAAKVWPAIDYYLALNTYNCLAGRMFWQPFTYMFVHGNFQHLFFNMLGLFFFATSVERAIGSREFLLMYLTVGVLGGVTSLLVYFFTGMYLVYLLGASGAIYGMLFAYAVIFPKNRIFIWGIIPVPSPILVIAYAVIEVLSQFTGTRSGVAHMTHLAGFAFAFLYFVIRMGVNPIKVWKDAYR